MLQRLFLKVSLTEAEKSFLVKSLSFSLPPRQLNLSDYLINLELLLEALIILKFFQVITI